MKPYHFKLTSKAPHLRDTDCALLREYFSRDVAGLKKVKNGDTPP